MISRYLDVLSSVWLKLSVSYILAPSCFEAKSGSEASYTFYEAPTVFQTENSFNWMSGKVHNEVVSTDASSVKTSHCWDTSQSHRLKGKKQNCPRVKHPSAFEASLAINRKRDCFRSNFRRHTTLNRWQWHCEFPYTFAVSHFILLFGFSAIRFVNSGFRFPGLT